MGELLTSIKVNHFEADWTDDGRRKQLPCTGCGEPTRGRATVIDSAEYSGVRTVVSCVGCLMKTAMTKGLQPVRSAIEKAGLR